MAPRARVMLISLWVALCIATGCSHAPAPSVDLDATRADGQVGIASFYGAKFEGRRTASGERYEADEMTAAHRTLPFGTRLRVTHLASGRTVEVTVNDRGPFRKGRIVDLSRRAAEALGILAAGLAKVRVDVIAGQ